MKNYNYISPGVYINEFDETLTPTFRMDTDVLVPGYFSRGPIAVPVKLDNLSAYTIVFGTPETEAEKYAYYACKAVFDQGATVTALRMPYFNSTWAVNPKAEQTGIPYIAKYKGCAIRFKSCGTIDGKFITDTDQEIAATFANRLNDSYESGLGVNGIIKPVTTLQYFTQDDIAQVRKAKNGADCADAIIINKFNDKLSNNGKELMVSIVGAGNAMYNQGLIGINGDGATSDADFTIYDNLIVSGTDSDATFVSLDNKLIAVSDEITKNPDYISKLDRQWQYSGMFTSDGELAIAPETFASDLNVQFPSIPTYTVNGMMADVQATTVTMSKYIENIGNGKTTDFNKYELQTTGKYTINSKSEDQSPLSEDAEFNIEGFAALNKETYKSANCLTFNHAAEYSEDDTLAFTTFINNVANNINADSSYKYVVFTTVESVNEVSSTETNYVRTYAIYKVKVGMVVALEQSTYSDVNKVKTKYLYGYLTQKQPNGGFNPTGDNEVTLNFLSPSYRFHTGFSREDFINAPSMGVSPTKIDEMLLLEGNTNSVETEFGKYSWTDLSADRVYVRFEIKAGLEDINFAFVNKSVKLAGALGTTTAKDQAVAPFGKDQMFTLPVYVNLDEVDPDLTVNTRFVVNNYYNIDYAADSAGATQVTFPTDSFTFKESLLEDMKVGGIVNNYATDSTNGLLVVPGTTRIEEQDSIFIEETKDDFITVVVSQVVPSSTEAGKFNIVTLEVWNGSIDPMSMNAVSRQSDFIGDIINDNSDYIQYFSRSSIEKFNTSTKGYLKSENVILNFNDTPYRFSWIPKSLVDRSSEDLVPRIMPVIIDQQYNNDGTVASISYGGRDDNVNWIDDVLVRTLNQAKNKVVYTFRDCVDAGLSSVYNYFATPNAKIETEYDSEAYENSNNPAGDYAGWKLVAAALSQFCQFRHKLSMFHIDGPRNLVIDGSLSRSEDEYIPMLNASKQCMFNPKTLAVLKLGNTSYSQTNLEWWECYDVFSQRKIWLPSSIKTIGNLMYNDFNRHVWDAPAGQNYGVVGDAFRPAFNPEIEVTDKIYAQYLNYGNSWPNGVMTIEGQKTNYAQNSAFNRINVRRLFLYLERWAQTVCQTFVYEPNNMYTWQRMKDALEPEFARIFNEGGLYDYRIVIDERNNPPEVIDNNELRVAIFLQPVKTAERIVCAFVATKTGIDLDERIAQGIEY